MKLASFSILIIAVVVGVQSECNCYEPEHYTGSTAAISNAYDHNTFGSCYKPCSFVAFSGDLKTGWTRLQFRWGTVTNSGGLLQIYDGTSDSSSLLATVTEGENVLSGSAKSLIKSTSSSIFVKYTQTGNGTNIYYGSIKAILPL